MSLPSQLEILTREMRGISAIVFAINQRERLDDRLESIERKLLDFADDLERVEKFNAEITAFLLSKKDKTGDDEAENGSSHRFGA